MNIKLGCICGAAMNRTVKGGNLHERMKKLVDLFREAHSGAGHEICDLATARRARAREERINRRLEDL